MLKWAQGETAYPVEDMTLPKPIYPRIATKLLLVLQECSQLPALPKTAANMPGRMLSLRVLVEPHPPSRRPPGPLCRLPNGGDGESLQSVDKAQRMARWRDHGKRLQFRLQHR